MTALQSSQYRTDPIQHSSRSMPIPLAASCDARPNSHLLSLVPSAGSSVASGRSVDSSSLAVPSQASLPSMKVTTVSSSGVGLVAVWPVEGASATSGRSPRDMYRNREYGSQGSLPATLPSFLYHVHRGGQRVTGLKPRSVSSSRSRVSSVCVGMSPFIHQCLARVGLANI